MSCADSLHNTLFLCALALLLPCKAQKAHCSHISSHALLDLQTGLHAAFHIHGLTAAGTRYLFREQRVFGGFGDFGGNFDPPEGFSPPTGSDMPDMSDLLGSMPFSIIFESVIKAVDTGLLVIVCVCGLLSLRKYRKLTK